MLIGFPWTLNGCAWQETVGDRGASKGLHRRKKANPGTLDSLKKRGEASQEEKLEIRKSKIGTQEKLTQERAGGVTLRSSGLKTRHTNAWNFGEMESRRVE